MANGMIKTNPMTYETAKEIFVFSANHVKALVIGLVDNGDGTYKVERVMCNSKFEIIEAVSGFKEFEVFYVKKANEQKDFFTSQVKNINNIKK